MKLTMLTTMIFAVACSGKGDFAGKSDSNKSNDSAKKAPASEETPEGELADMPVMVSGAYLTSEWSRTDKDNPNINTFAYSVVNPNREKIEEGKGFEIKSWIVKDQNGVEIPADKINRLPPEQYAHLEVTVDKQIVKSIYVEPVVADPSRLDKPLVHDKKVDDLMYYSISYFKTVPNADKACQNQDIASKGSNIFEKPTIASLLPFDEKNCFELLPGRGVFYNDPYADISGPKKDTCFEMRVRINGESVDLAVHKGTGFNKSLFDNLIWALQCKQ